MGLKQIRKDFRFTKNTVFEYFNKLYSNKMDWKV